MHLFKTNQKISLRRHSGPIWFLIATRKLSTDLKQMCRFNFRAKPENNWKLCSLLFFIHIRIGQFLIWVLWILIEIQPFHHESFLFKTILRNPKKTSDVCEYWPKVHINLILRTIVGKTITRAKMNLQYQTICWELLFFLEGVSI